MSEQGDFTSGAEELAWTLRVKASDAMKEFEELQKRIEEAKKKLVEMREQTQATFDQLGIALKTADKNAGGQLGTSAISQAVKQLKEEEKEAGKAAQQHYADAGQAAQAYQQRIIQVAQQIQQLSKTQGVSLKAAGQGLMASGAANTKEVTAALQMLNTTAKASEGAFNSLGSVAKFVFGGIFAITVVGALRSVINFMKEAVLGAAELEKSFYMLEVGVRGLQRAGFDTTIEEWKSYIKDLQSQFPIFSKQQIAEAVNQMILTARTLGLTTAQMKDLTKASIVLAEVNGKDLVDTIRMVDLAISAQYTEGLQRLKVNISKAVLAQKALDMGFKDNYNSLSQTDKALVTYTVLMENVAGIQEDAGKITETTAGQLMELSASWDNLKRTIGDGAGWKALITFLGWVVQGLQILHNLWNGTFRFIGATMKALPEMASSTIQAWKELLSGSEDALENHASRMNRIIRSIFQETLYPNDKDILGDLPNDVRDAFADAATAAEEAAAQADLDQIYQEMVDKIEKILEDGKNRQRDLEIDYTRDLEDIDEGFMQDSVDAWTDYQRKLEDLQRDYQQRIEDENRDYSERRAQVIRDYALRAAEIEENYRNNEITAEQRYQERLRQLREGFLFDLEDAVRERDARQVIRLTKQYDLEKQQLAREEKLRKDDAARQYKLDMARLGRERAARLYELQLEHEARLAELKRQNQREQDEAKLAYDRKMSDLELEQQREKEERLEKYQEQQDDLERSIQDRLNAEAKGFMEEYNLTASQAENIYQKLKEYFGPGGYIEGLYLYVYQMILGLQAAATAITGAAGGEAPAPPPPPEDGGGQAEGGTYFVNKPTTFKAGDAGPEMASFTPLGRRGVNTNRTFGSPPAGLGGAGQGKVLIRLGLSPELIAEVIDKSVSEVADVVMEVNRERV